MRRIPKLIKWTALAALLVYAAALTHAGLTKADSPGQIEGGNIFQARNLTSGSNYADPQSAKACDELKYNITLHNPAFGQVSGLTASVNLPGGNGTSNVASMSANFSGAASAVTDTATVNLDSAQSITFEPGSAVLLDSNGNMIQALPDALVNGGGASLGNLAGSGLEYVQFKAKVSCQTPPPPVFSCDELSAQVGDNRTVTITAFNVTAKNGATFKSADINWGDNSSDTGLTTVVGKTHQYSADGTFTISATAHFDVNGVDKTAGGPNCMTTVKIKTQTPPPPVFTCDLLGVKQDDNSRTVTVTTFNVTAKNGATFKNADINWGDGHTDTGVNPVVGKTHQYGADGTFTISAIAHFDVNGQDKTADGTNCKTSVTIKKQTPPPIFTCDMLSITAKDMSATITGFKTTAQNGAKFKSVDIDWGDNHSDKGLTSPVGKSHTYSDFGSFTISATAHFDVNGQDKTADGPNCQQTVTFKKGKPPVVTPPTINNVNNNTNINNNTNVSGGQGAGAAPSTPGAAGTPETTAPGELVNTGPGSLIAIFLAATAFGTFAFRYFLRRSMS